MYSINLQMRINVMVYSLLINSKLALKFYFYINFHKDFILIKFVTLFTSEIEYRDSATTSDKIRSFMDWNLIWSNLQDCFTYKINVFCCYYFKDNC